MHVYMNMSIYSCVAIANSVRLSLHCFFHIAMPNELQTNKQEVKPILLLQSLFEYTINSNSNEESR